VAFAHSIRKIREDYDGIGNDHYSSLPDFAAGEKSIAPPYGRISFATVERLLEEKTGLNLVEIGTSWIRGDIFGNGYSTPFFSHLAKKGGHNFYSVDINPKGLETAGKVLADYGLNHDGTHLVAADGIEFLSRWGSEREGKIDFLYLDGWDYSPDDLRMRGIIRSERKHLEAMQAAMPHMADGALVLIDDTLDHRALSGKGRETIPFLAEQGWELLEAGWQFLLRKPS
jgi:hypothetical protein